MLFRTITVLIFILIFGVQSYKIIDLVNLANTKPGDDKKECVNAVVKVVSTENAGNLNGFHEKPEFDKIKALHEELMLMMRNGTSDWQKIGHLISITAGELGGQDEFLKSYIEHYSNQLAKSNLNETVICFIFVNFDLFYKETKKAIGTKVGTSDRFLPMIKDMIMSTNLETTNLEDAPGLMFAVGYTMMLALPEEIFKEITSSTNLETEATFKRKIRKVKPFLKDRFSQFQFSFMD